jgi:hypothetical protein
MMTIRRLNQTKPNQTKPNQTKPNQTKSNQIKPNQTQSTPKKKVIRKLFFLIKELIRVTPDKL